MDWTSYRDASGEEHHAKFEAYSAQDFMPVDIEAYTNGGALNYAAIWVKNTEGIGWVLLRDMSSDDYADKFKKYRDEGYRVADLVSYRFNNQQFYAAIWVKNVNGRGWYAYRDQSSKELGDLWLKLRDAGYRLTSYEAYDTADGIRYLGIWRQNSERPDWAFKDEVNTALEKYAADNGIPALSVAIAINGEFKYLRSLGFANVNAKQIAHSGTIYRLASTSKAVAGVLTMDLVDANEVDVDDLTRTHAPTLPAHHIHNLEQLLSVTSGVRHYGGADDPTRNVTDQYDTALTASALFAADPLLFAPGTSSTYSTHGFTLLGAALEGATGKSIAPLVQEQLSDLYNLPTLRAEDRSQANSNRATLYQWQDDEAVAVTPDNISWKVLGGGLEASSYDLARMGIKLMNGQILSQASLDALWTRPDCSKHFALGWDINTHWGHCAAARQGAQLGARSTILLYPDDQIAIVVLSNIWRGSAPQLAKDIAQIILNGDMLNASRQSSNATVEPPDKTSEPVIVEELDPVAEMGEPFVFNPTPVVERLAPALPDDATRKTNPP